MFFFQMDNYLGLAHWSTRDEMNIVVPFNHTVYHIHNYDNGLQFNIFNNNTSRLPFYSAYDSYVFCFVSQVRTYSYGYDSRVIYLFQRGGLITTRMTVMYFLVVSEGRTNNYGNDSYVFFLEGRTYNYEYDSYVICLVSEGRTYNYGYDSYVFFVLEGRTYNYGYDSYVFFVLEGRTYNYGYDSCVFFVLEGRTYNYGYDSCVFCLF